MVTVTPIEIEFHDTRISGSGRQAPHRAVRYANKDTPISAAIDTLSSAISMGAQITRLDIVAHGFHVTDPQHGRHCVPQDEEKNGPLFGIMLGHDGIHGGFTAIQDLKDEDTGEVVFKAGTYPENLSLWSPFKGKIDEIRFYSCSAASRVRWSGVGLQRMELTGYEMCSRLAIISGAYVMAAELTQMYDTPSGATDFGAWDGPVDVFSPISGRVIASSTDGRTPVYSRGL